MNISSPNKKIFNIYLPIFVLFVFLFVIDVHAQQSGTNGSATTTQMFSVSGILLKNDGSPSAGVKLTVVPATDEGGFILKKDKGGEFYGTECITDEMGNFSAKVKRSYLGANHLFTILGPPKGMNIPQINTSKDGQSPSTKKFKIDDKDTEINLGKVFLDS